MNQLSGIRYQVSGIKKKKKNQERSIVVGLGSVHNNN